MKKLGESFCLLLLLSACGASSEVVSSTINTTTVLPVKITTTTTTTFAPTTTSPSPLSANSDGIDLVDFEKEIEEGIVEILTERGLDKEEAEKFAHEKLQEGVDPQVVNDMILIFEDWMENYPLHPVLGRVWTEENAQCVIFEMMRKGGVYQTSEVIKFAARGGMSEKDARFLVQPVSECVDLYVLVKADMNLDKLENVDCIMEGVTEEQIVEWYVADLSADSLSFFDLYANDVNLSCSSVSPTTTVSTMTVAPTMTSTMVSTTTTVAPTTTTAVSTTTPVSTTTTTTMTPTTTTSEVGNENWVEELLSLLVLDNASAPVDYDRDDWGSGWSDDDGDCINTRHEVLLLESLSATSLSSSGCSVSDGEWYAAFTGTYVTNPSSLDIDHFVPLANAHDSGGWAWSSATKESYYNDLVDPQHLIAVTASANRSKGSRGPEEWKPSDSSYWCQYADSWVDIKIRWALTVTSAEFSTLQSMLDTCEGQPIGIYVPPASISTATTTTTVPTATTSGVPNDPGNSKNCSDFSTYAEAKTWFDIYFPHYGDVARLDGDGDGEPCESLPGGP